MSARDRLAEAFAFQVQYGRDHPSECEEGVWEAAVEARVIVKHTGLPHRADDCELCACGDDCYVWAPGVLAAMKRMGKP